VPSNLRRRVADGIAAVGNR